MKDYNKKLLKGSWYNNEIEYHFEDKAVSFRFLKSKDNYKGFYNLNYNNVKLTYRRNQDETFLTWEAVIEKLDNENLVFIDISNEIGRREFFLRKLEVNNEIVIHYSKIENNLSVLAFISILLFVIVILTDKWIFGDSTFELIIGSVFFPSIIYLRKTYKKIVWVKTTIDDLYKLLKDIIGNNTVQVMFVIGVGLIFLGAIIIPMIQMIIMFFS